MTEACPPRSTTSYTVRATKNSKSISVLGVQKRQADPGRNATVKERGDARLYPSGPYSPPPKALDPPRARSPRSFTLAFLPGLDFLNPLHRCGVEFSVGFERLRIERAAGPAVEAGLVPDTPFHERSAEVSVRAADDA